MQRYHLHNLTYYEMFSPIGSAIVREEQIKGWLTKINTALIVSMNSKWNDPAADWLNSRLKPNVTPWQ